MTFSADFDCQANVIVIMLLAEFCIPMHGEDNMETTESLPQGKTETVRQFEALVALLDSFDDIAQWQARSPEDRSQAFVELCNEAASIEASKRQLGLPTIPPEPWPRSTWEHLRRHAAS